MCIAYLSITVLEVSAPKLKLQDNENLIFCEEIYERRGGGGEKDLIQQEKLILIFVIDNPKQITLNFKKWTMISPVEHSSKNLVLFALWLEQSSKLEDVFKIRRDHSKFKHE